MKLCQIFIYFVLSVGPVWAADDLLLQEQATAQDFSKALDIYYEAIQTNIEMGSQKSSTLTDVYALCQNFQDFEIFLRNNRKYAAQYTAYMWKFQRPETMDETIQFVTNLNRESAAECAEAEQYHRSLSRLPIE